MEYRINVAKLEEYQGKMRYVYVFCTKQLGMYSAKRAYDEIKAKFPEPEYQVSFEVWEYSGKEVNADEYFAKNS
jgi:hypothetical protein